MTPRLRLWMVLGLVAAAYIGAPQAGLAWDDHALITTNKVLDAPTFETVWLRDLWSETGTDSTGYHRPLLTVSFLLDFALFGREPGGYHVTSVLWHLLVVALVAGVLRDRVGPVRANVAALIFGLHPVQSEAVMWISGRNDLMSAAFVLGTLLALDRKRPWIAVLTTFAGCLSKENAYLLPVVLWVWRRAWGEGVSRAELGAVGLGLAGALAIRLNATLAPPPAVHGAFTTQAALTGLVTVLGWVTWPWPLTTTASVLMPAPRPGAWPAAVATLGLVGVLLRLGGARAFWLLALGAGVLAPAAFGVRYYGTFGERYLYLPLFGLIAAGVVAAPAVRWAGAALVPLVVAALGVLHVRVPEWADEETLFTAAVRRAPDGHSLGLLGVELGRQKRSLEALQVLDRAIAVVPAERRACWNLLSAGNSVLTDADFARFSRLWAERACKGYPGYDGRRAQILAQRGLWAEAAVVANEAVRNDVPERRDELVRAAVDERDGNLDALSARAMAWPGGAADLRDRVATLLRMRHRPSPPAVEAGGPSANVGAAGVAP